MTELEKLLQDGLQTLAEQYQQDMQRLETQTSSLQQQVSDLSTQLQTNARSYQKQLDGLTLRIRQLTELLHGLE